MLSGNDRILITGGAGLIGSHIADQLVKRYNPEIIVLDSFVHGRRENLRWARTHGRIEVVEGDIRDGGLLHDVMGGGIDYVFHQASIPCEQCIEDPRLAMEVLADGTFNVLEAAALNRVRKIVARSSSWVYGCSDDYPTKETHHPYNNRSLYGAAMTFIEGLLRSFYEMYGVKYVGLRYFDVYGPRMNLQNGYAEVMIRWMDRLVHRQPCIITGDGSETMDLIYVEDIARANILAANSPVCDEVINIASGVETNLNELAALLSQIMGATVLPEYGPQRKGWTMTRRHADVRKAEALLGFRPEVPLEEGLSRLVTWWERQRALESAIA